MEQIFEQTLQKVLSTNVEELSLNQCIFLDTYNFIKKNPYSTFEEYQSYDFFKLSKAEFDSIKSYFNKTFVPTFLDYKKHCDLPFVPFLSHIYTNDIKMEKNVIEAIEIIQEWFILNPPHISYKFNNIHVKTWIRNLIQHNQDEWELVLANCNRNSLYKIQILSNMICDYVISTNKLPPGSIWNYPKFLQTALSYTYNLYIKKENTKRYPFLDLVLPYEHSPINNFLQLHKCLTNV